MVDMVFLRMGKYGSCTLGVAIWLKEVIIIYLSHFFK